MRKSKFHLCCHEKHVSTSNVTSSMTCLHYVSKNTVQNIVKLEMQEKELITGFQFDFSHLVCKAPKTHFMVSALYLHNNCIAHSGLAVHLSDFGMTISEIQ